jgi:hypothetical protein
VGCTPNAASLKKLEQMSKRRLQTAPLFSTLQSAGNPMTANVGLATPSHATRRFAFDHDVYRCSIGDELGRARSCPRPGA